MKVSWVTANTAGTESTAKIRSTISTMISATPSGVSHSTSLPVFLSGSRTMKLRPRSASVMRNRLRRNLKMPFFSRSGSSSWWLNILMPVNTRKAPKMKRIQSN